MSVTGSGVLQDWEEQRDWSDGSEDGERSRRRRGEKNNQGLT